MTQPIPNEFDSSVYTTRLKARGNRLLTMSTDDQVRAFVASPEPSPNTEKALDMKFAMGAQNKRGSNE